MFRQQCRILSYPSVTVVFRAVVLMSPENPSDALSAFLAKKASSIAKDIFEVMWNKRKILFNN